MGPSSSSAWISGGIWVRLAHRETGGSVSRASDLEGTTTWSEACYLRVREQATDSEPQFSHLKNGDINLCM